ncbi:amidase [Cyclobacterium salsum]|uniref:amidase n=1 Tax=Cyclobacterium salsum TaxID=2666329 RepID=UPI001390DBA5|nr:amidase [Cyclobacterium salsum]
MKNNIAVQGKSNQSRRKFLALVGASSAAAMTFSPANLSASIQPPNSPYRVSKDETDELIFMSVTKLSEMIRTKKVSSVELTQAYIDRIEKVNYHLNAVVMQCFERALDEAKAADAALKKKQIRGPLHGVPMTLKDSFEAEGVISTGGTLGRIDYVGKKDATVLARMRQNGAILLGKTNTPEFTLAGGGMRGVRTTGNIIYGLSKNPYDLTRGTSGSSGGAGSIVAAGGAGFDIGTDWGGSVRLPSSTNGIAGLKPTSVRCPRTGHIVDYGGVFDSWQQPGPMARRVEDLMLLTPLMSGPDGMDAAVVPMPWPDPEQIDIKRLKVAYYPSNLIADTAEETQNTIKQAAKWMEEAGAEVTEDMPLEIFTELGEIRRELVSGDAWAFLKRAGDLHGSKTLSESIQNRLDNGTPISADRYSELLTLQDKNRTRMLQWFQKYDVILCPTTATPAEEIDQGIGSEWTSSKPGASYCGPYNTTGWPVTVVRGDANGALPVGVQCVAHPWREDVSLAVAQYLESRSGGWRRPMI